MKKILLAVVAVMAIMVSCQKEKANEPLTLEEQLGFEIKSTFQATIAGSASQQNAPKDGIGTMAHLGNDNFVYWDENDEITVNGNVHITRFNGSGENITVDFYDDEDVPLGEDNKYHAFYPSDIQNKNDYSKGTLPAFQTFSYTESQTRINLPMYAVTTAPSHELEFYNICSILEITIPAGIEANKIEISADEALYGTFQMVDGKLVMDVEGNENNKTLTIAAETGTTWLPGTVVKCAIPGRPYDEATPDADASYYHNMKITIFKTDASGVQNGSKLIRQKAKFKVKPSHIYKMSINQKAAAANNGLFVKNSSGTLSVFSVSATKTVNFTAGNLWYDNTQTPHIEATQVDYPNYYSEGDLLHVGHLYWTGNVASAIQKSTPTVAATDNDYFLKDPITVEGISGLEVLTTEEWTYLVSTRTNASTLMNKCVAVDGVDCLVFAPDGYTGTIPSSCTYQHIADEGLLCLPFAGIRKTGGEMLILSGGGKDKDYRLGRFWSKSSSKSNDSTKPASSHAENLNCGAIWSNNNNYCDVFLYQDAKNTGRSIRLVKVATPQ